MSRYVDSVSVEADVTGNFRCYQKPPNNSFNSFPRLPAMHDFGHSKTKQKKRASCKLGSVACISASFFSQNKRILGGIMST